MELWLDTVEIALIERARELGLLCGVTTNPQILSQAQQPAEVILDEVLHRFSGPIAVQVTVHNTREMIEQGKDLVEFSPRIIVKIPATEPGYAAIHALSHIEIPTMATAIFEPKQAFLAAKAGACYLAPYFSHMEGDPLATCLSMQRILTNNHFSTKLLIAALQSMHDLERCMEQGFGAATLKPELFRECLTPPSKTQEHLNRFDAAWENAAPSHLLSNCQLTR